IREYAGEELTRNNEEDKFQRRHAAYIGREVHALKPDLRRLDPHALARIAPEQDNLRSAFTWATNHDADLAAGLLGDLTSYWIRRGMASEALHLVELIPDLSTSSTNVQADVLTWKSELLRFIGRREESIELM